MRFRLARAMVLLTAAGACLAGSAVAAAPAGAPPPTYDYDAQQVGTQPPQAPSLAHYDYRSVRAYQVTFTALVPQTELQAVLPGGFTALPSAPGSALSNISLAFFLDQRFEQTGVGTFGPVSAVLVSTTATNTTLSPARPELVFPAFEASGEVDALNVAFGPGSARLAQVSVAVSQARETMAFSFEVKDKGLGLDLRAAATSPSAINVRSVSDPVGIAFRTFQDGRAPNKAFHAASQSDTLTLPSSAAKVHLKAAGGRLRVPHGALTLVDVGPTVTFARNVEFVVAFE